MRLALTDLFHARWTDTIHEEWIRSVLKNRPDITREHLEHTRCLMNSYVRDGLVSGYEELIPALTLPDPDDRHVLAAAICSHADVIVTFNLKHYPEAVLDKYGIEAQHPDEFLLDLFDLSPHAVLQTIKEQRQALKKPLRTVEEHLAVLERQQLAMTVFALREYADLI